MKTETCEICDTRFEDGSCHCSRAMDAHFKSLDLQRKRDEKVLKLIEGMVSKKIMDFIMTDFSEMDAVYDFQIVCEPRGEKQENYGVEYYVDEHLNGGHTGDCFEGYCFVDMGNGQYFRYTYEC